jgi:NADH-quinone oxidoreductase subunit L
MAAVLVILTIGLPWFGAGCIWLVAQVCPRDRRPRLLNHLAAAFSITAAVAALALIPYASDQVVLTLSLGGVFGNFTFVPDGLGIYLSAVATVIGSLTIIFSLNYMAGERQLGRYYALILFFIGAMAGLVLSGSLLLMFLFWEITAFCSYALIAFHNDDPKAVAGGIKALIVTQIGGVGLLAGALVAYSYLGSYQVGDLLAGANTLPAGVLSLVAFGFLLAAVAKSAQVPLHTWLPDAMEAPTPVTALIHAATMVNAGVYLLARFYPAFADVPGWKSAVVVVGLLSALLAAIMALVTDDLKRVLAYSTVSQLGYMVYAVGVGAIFASQFHLVSHALFKGLLFLAAGAVIHSVGTRDMRAMGGLRIALPVTRTVFVIGALALAGLPITNGFFSKELVLEGGLEHGALWAYIGMLIGAGLTAIYTIRMTSMVFYSRPIPPPIHHPPGRAMRFSLVFLAAATLTSWLLAGPFNRLLADTLPHHLLSIHTTLETVTEILAAPATWLALGVIGLGLAIWWLRPRLGKLLDFLQPVARAARKDLGFEWLNQGIIRLTQQTTEALAQTQTGILNWNVAGIVGGLILVLAILIWSVR